MHRILFKKILKYLINNNIWFPHVLGVYEKPNVCIINYDYGIWIDYIPVDHYNNTNTWYNTKTGKTLPNKIKWIIEACRNKTFNTDHANIDVDVVDRFEVIDINGRVILYANKKIELSFQDEKKTLKIFVSEK